MHGLDNVHENNGHMEGFSLSAPYKYRHHKKHRGRTAAGVGRMAAWDRILEAQKGCDW